jgi:hypothetical protein
MKLEYEAIEDSFDDTTHIRTMTEQARVPGKGWLIRTTIYTPHHIASDVTFLADKTVKARSKLFATLLP